jgi:thioredoxin-related protein
MLKQVRYTAYFWRFMIKIPLIVLFLLAFYPLNATSETEVFADVPLENRITLPEWFKLSFLDLQDDVDEAKGNDKKGLIIYFGQKKCPYCKAFLENSWGREDIVNYTKKYFDVVAIDTKGGRPVTDFSGMVYDEKSYAYKMKANFTPTLLFIDNDANVIFKMTGYQAPYRFMAGLEYIADQHYLNKSFKSYIDQAGDEAILNSGKDALNFQSFFDSPPYNLARNRIKSEQPLAVIFEQISCHTCDVLHAIPLSNPAVRKKISQFQTVQLDVHSRDLLITPDGRRSNAAEWANTLELSYSPTIVFFDEEGKEIIRIDSLVWVNRLEGVLDYILTKAYKIYPNFQQWRNSVQ